MLVGFLTLKMLHSLIDGCYLTFNLKIDRCFSTHCTRSNDIPVLSCSLLLLLLLLQKRNDQLVSVSQACFALFGAGLARPSVSSFRTRSLIKEKEEVKRRDKHPLWGHYSKE